MLWFNLSSILGHNTLSGSIKTKMPWTQMLCKTTNQHKAILSAQQVTSNPHPSPLQKKGKKKKKKHFGLRS